MKKFGCQAGDILAIGEWDGYQRLTQQPKKDGEVLLLAIERRKFQ
jgi:hypothetical protein